MTTPKPLSRVQPVGAGPGAARHLTLGAEIMARVPAQALAGAAIIPFGLAPRQSAPAPTQLHEAAA